MDPNSDCFEASWHALEHAGILPQRVTGSRTGVFMGTAMGLRPIQPTELPSQAYAGTGNTRAWPPTESPTYDFRPSMAIDTACSSSLVAVHQAVRSLRQGESRLALAGGVNLILTS